MIAICGLPVSNFTNIVKAAALEKGFDTSWVAIRPGQDQEMLASSPMGRVPFIQTRDGPVSETLAILTYLDSEQKEPRLCGNNSHEKAKVVEVILMSSFYLEPVARKAYGFVFGKEVHTETCRQIEEEIQKPVEALKILSKFDPWVCGASFTYADLVLYWVLRLANFALDEAIGLKLVDELGARDWISRMEDRKSVRQLVDIEDAYRQEKALPAL